MGKDWHSMTAKEKWEEMCESVQDEELMMEKEDKGGVETSDTWQSRLERLYKDEVFK